MGEVLYLKVMVISTSRYLPCTWQNILEQSEKIYGSKYYVQLDLMSQLMGYEVAVDNNVYLNTLRGEKNPSCQYKIGDDDIVRLLDYGSTEWNSSSCFDLLIKKSKNDVRPIRTFSEALKIVNEKYGLGLGRSDKTVIDHAGRDKHTYVIEKRKSRTEIRVEARNGFSQEGLDYWANFGIDPIEFNQSVENEKVYEVVQYYYVGKRGDWIRVVPRSLCFAFYFEDTEHFKIYTPYPTDTEQKWLTNTSTEDVFGKHDYDTSSSVIVTKSWKDRQVLKNLGFNAIAFQNEGCTPSVNCTWILFDNDDAGREASQKLAEHYVAKSIELDPRFGCKDVAEFYEKYGPDKTKLIINKLLT